MPLLLKNLWGLVAGGASAWVEDKLEDRKTKRELKVMERTRVLDRADKDQDAGISWDNLMAKGSQESWKDEFWTILLAAPLVMLFWPSGEEKSVHQIALDGFTRLNEAPEWYTMAIAVAIGAAFGYHKIIKPMTESRKK